LKNLGGNFQREMDHAFKDLIGKILLAYEDDMTIHLKLREYHIKHLRQVFERCRMYGISLNPKKCVFELSKGKLLGQIVSKEVIYIDPKRIKSINDMSPPTSKKGVRSLFGKINFVRQIVLIYATIVNPINKLLKKDNKKIEWTTEIQVAFTKINHAITIVPFLFIPSFDKYFILYLFAS
jgi:hypothetical protein